MSAHGARRGRLVPAGMLVVFSCAALTCGNATWGTVGLVGAGGVVVLVGAVVYVRSDRVALRTMRAYPVGEADYPELCRVVGELSRELRLPLPAVYVSPAATPNAFVTGRTPRRAAICVTRGLLATLEPRELRAVVGHELAHVAARDIMASSIGAAVAGLIVCVAEAASKLPIGRRGGRGRRTINPVAGVLLLILGPFAGCVLHVAISRSREYAADFESARVTGDPEALASALRKLHDGVRSTPLPPQPELRAAAALMIADPFPTDGIARVLSTHPSTEERVRRLERIAA